MTKRTDEEIRAYIDGYNACYRQFYECLKRRRTVIDAIKLMKSYVVTINKITGSIPEFKGDEENDKT